MHIAIACDHAGFDYKERLKLYLIEEGHLVEDFGTDSEQPVDYPRFIRPAAQAVASGEYDRGIVLGGSGNGEAIVANRVPGVRCTLCWDLRSARLARQHNDANVLSLGQRLLPFDLARARHARRVRQIDRPARHPPPPHINGPLPRRLALEDEATCICNSCREEFQVPVDISAGTPQFVVEECPVCCCHENPIRIEIDDEGVVHVSGEQDVNV
jgi:ribose 5-phosphate isomerase B